jgi:hypothetical protein
MELTVYQPRAHCCGLLLVQAELIHLTAFRTSLSGGAASPLDQLWESHVQRGVGMGFSEASAPNR